MHLKPTVTDIVVKQCSDRPQKFVSETGWLKALGVVTTGFGVTSPALEFYRGSCKKHAMKSGWVISWEKDCDSQHKEQSRGLSQSVRNIYEILKSCPSHRLLMHTRFSGCHFWTHLSLGGEDQWLFTVTSLTCSRWKWCCLPLVLQGFMWVIFSDEIVLYCITKKLKHDFKKKKKKRGSWHLLMQNPVTKEVLCPKGWTRGTYV